MNKRNPIIMGIFLMSLAIWLQITSIPNVRLVLSRIENIVYDMQLRTQLLTHPPSLKESTIVIVDVDDESLQKEGRWPWPRAKLAQLVDNLQKAGAVVIAFDMIFPQLEVNIVDEISQELQKENLAAPQLISVLNKLEPFFNNDAKFAASLQHGDDVVGVNFTQFFDVNGIIPTPILILKTPQEKQLDFFVMNGVDGANPVIATAAKNEGFINVFPDSDGIIRRVPLLLRYHDGLYPSLALEAVRVYLLANISLVTAEYDKSLRIEGIKLNDYVIPTDSKAQVLIPFEGKSFTYPYFSAHAVLENKIPANALAGKIVFVGTSATGLGDLKATAIQNPYPGVEVHAAIADGILKKNFSYMPAWDLGAELFLIIALGGLLLFVCPYLGPRILAILIIIMPVILIILNNELREKTGLIITISIPIMLCITIALLNLIYGYLFETRRRENLKEMFGQYVPEKHIDEMLKSSGQFGLYGEDRDMTVMFADIRNFTTISEPMTATQLKEYLNVYLNPMTEIIFKYNGTIDKYIGDLIMAFWGAPLRDRKHAQHAIYTALDMQREVKKLNVSFEAQHLPPIHIGIGLNSGMMSVGDMGSKFRRNYTVLGDAVNLGSRAESLTKFYGVQIIVTEHTHKNQTKFIFRLLDRVRVKGKTKGIELYEVVCRQQDATDELKKEIMQHEEAMHFYFQQQWLKAREIFINLEEKHPHMKLYQIYLERIAEFLKTPPPEDWDGVYTHLHK